ncbi:DUF3426 domain-containing protein [Advenella mimigardefordensis]|uniref:Putative MJ0042 family finger-like domain-containing membrane protein n=1 Tax=Advenella mimigardefordensis (strain DSM 17166 / LMG 22922 / DPN7) TaxID=1247726 RepID=W0PDQ8_ADVMD|nr:DUF3426 domain-containing protein [Advenella mimigardefordensis]AHG65004.1 putative MJ0042 family finger-like domain-containing membrane protein [Advenella mimigardefordensis DPN7]
MKTRCPDCSTRFDVTPAQLNAREGKVRCGVCSTVFNAFEHEVDDETDFPVLQAEQPHTDTLSAGSEPAPASRHSLRDVRDTDRQARAAASPRQYHEDADPLSDQAIEPTLDELDDRSTPRRGRVRDRDRGAGERFLVDAPSLSGSGAYNQDGRGAAPRVHVEGQYRRRVQRDTEYDDPEHSNGSGLIWFLAVLFALIILFAQGAVVFRNQIVNVAPTLRPQLVQLCSFVGCEVGYTRSVRHLAILKPALRQVKTPATTADIHSFRLQAILKNNDTIAQPLPSLVLSLKDASESVSARRIIKPEEYLLPDAQKRAFQPNDEIAIDLPVQVSRTDVAGFELSLFYP